jgi:hypothetical protein
MTKQKQIRAVLATDFQAGSDLAYFLTLKIESTFSPEMLVDLQRTTWRYIPEDRTLHNYCYENLKYCNYMSYPDIWAMLHSPSAVEFIKKIYDSSSIQHMEAFPRVPFISLSLVLLVVTGYC